MVSASLGTSYVVDARLETLQSTERRLVGGEPGKPRTLGNMRDSR
jgi:hypothetical protein